MLDSLFSDEDRNGCLLALSSHGRERELATLISVLIRTLTLLD